MVHKTQSRSELVSIAATLQEQGQADLAEQLLAVASKLEEAEAFDQMLLAAVDSLTEGLAIVDRQGRILFVNAEGQKIVGDVKWEAGPQEWSGEFGLYKSDGVTLFPVEQNPMALALRGKPASQAEMLVRNAFLPPEGVLINVTAAPVFGGSEQLGAVDVFRDIGEDKRRQRALEDALSEITAADDARRDFVAVASHELRASAATAAAAMSTLRKRWDVLDDAVKLKLIDQVDGVAHRMLRMLEDLLTTSKLDLGVVPVQPASIHLADLITLVQSDLADAEQFEVQCDPELVVHTDPEHARRILTNFVTNALKYGAAPFVIKAETTSRQALLRVEDAGVGVPDEFAPKLFSRFSRAGVEGTEGSGLGLAIVRGLARANGGDAWYEPVAPHGSCFAASFPLSA